jgi:DNA-binding NarL/FixJ family response regulator
VVGEAGDGEQAVAAVRRRQPDVVLMDIQMPRLDGIAATRSIARDRGLRSRVVILTTFEQDDYLFEALRAGASGFLLKNAPPEQLVQAVRPSRPATRCSRRRSPGESSRTTRSARLRAGTIPASTCSPSASSRCCACS